MPRGNKSLHWLLPNTVVYCCDGIQPVVLTGQVSIVSLIPTCSAYSDVAIHMLMQTKQKSLSHVNPS